jgi:hypothetical protein
MHKLNDLSANAEFPLKSRNCLTTEIFGCEEASPAVEESGERPKVNPGMISAVLVSVSFVEGPGNDALTQSKLTVQY